MSNFTKNEFVREVLGYSAERDKSISNPENWSEPHTLAVNTPLTREMIEFAEELAAPSKDPFWYFLVGGPGNGKSEAVGAFIRQLDQLTGKDNLKIAFPEGGQRVDYQLTVKLPGGKELIIIQDISIPKEKGSEPGKDLLETILNAHSKKANLLCCANRGMLLRAMRHANDEKYPEWLRDILKELEIRSGENATKKNDEYLDFDNIKTRLRVWPLDHESVLFGNARNPWSNPCDSLVDKVIKKAIVETNWETGGCQSCSAQDLCPFLSDVRWLRDDDRRIAFLRTWRRAEVLDGQRIVMREALSFLALVLVGTPLDFDQCHPCQWVQEKAKNLNSDVSNWKQEDYENLLNLLSHRIYNDLFSRQEPAGISLKGEKENWILKILAQAGDNGDKLQKAFLNVDSKFPKDSGPPRLVSEENFFKSFDPSRNISWTSRHREFLNKIEGQAVEISSVCKEYQSGLELALGKLLIHLEEVFSRNTNDHHVSHLLTALYRWGATYFLRFSGLAVGDSSMAPPLDNYLKLMEKPDQRIEFPNIEKEGSRLPIRLSKLLKGLDSAKGSLEIAPRIKAKTSNIDVKPQPARVRLSENKWPANDRLVLKLIPGSSSNMKSKSLYIVLSARYFVQLWNKHGEHMAPWSMSTTFEDLAASWTDKLYVNTRQFENSSTITFHSDEGGLSLEFDGEQIYVDVDG